LELSLEIHNATQGENMNEKSRVQVDTRVRVNPIVIAGTVYLSYQDYLEALENGK